MPPTSVNHRPRSSYLWPAVLIILIALALRLINTMSLPLYIDEIFHVWRAQKIALGEVFTGLDHNKWLYTALLALFNPRAGEALFIGRALTALISMLTISCCIVLGRLLDRPRTGLLAGGVYALLPLALFHERQALVDPTLALFAMLIVVLSVRVAKRPTVIYALLLALTLAGAYLSKATGILFFVMPITAIVLFAKRAHWPKLALLTAPALLIGLGVRTVLYQFAAEAGIEPRETHSANTSNLLINEGTVTEAVSTTLHDLGVVGSHFVIYVGPFLLLIMLVALIAGTRSDNWRQRLYLLVPAVVLWLPLLLVDRPHGGDIPARYLVAHAPMIAALGALCLAWCIDWAYRFGWGRYIILSMLIATGGLWLLFAFSLIIGPAQARLHALERRLYLGEDLVQTLAVQAANRQIGEQIGALGSEANPVTYLMHAGNIPSIEVYAGPYRANGLLVDQAEVPLEETLRPLVRAGQPIYVLEQDEFRIPRPLEQMRSMQSYQLTQIERLGDTSILYNLYLVDTFAPDFTVRLMNDYLPPEQALIDDAITLLAAVSADETVYVHPAHLTEFFQAQTELSVRPASDGTWPVNADQMATLLSAHPERVHLLMVQEADSDPDRTLQTALLDAYYLNEGWAGLLHLLTYSASAQGTTSLPVDAVYQGGIKIEMAVIDAPVSSGGLLHISVTWTTESTIDDSFAVFTHLVDQEGNLMAQFDGMPGNGLLQMTSWVPGERVTDRYAMALPADLPNGTYLLRVGVYNPSNGLRLPVIEPPDNELEQGSDYVTITEVTIDSDAGTQSTE